MRIRLIPGSKILLLLLVMAVALVGCSRINLAYRNLDLLIAWSLDDYLDMNRSQQTRLREQLREHIAWHCRTRLPVDLDALQRMQHQIRQGALDEQAVREHYGDIKQAVQAVAAEVTPTTVQLLRELDDRQVRQLTEALAQDQQEHQEKYLAVPLSQQIRERAERMTKRIEQSTGTLNAAQHQRILAWAHALGGQNRLWLENRQQWQNALIEALTERHEGDFEKRIAHLLQARESMGTDAYRTTLARNEGATIRLISEVYALSDANQRKKLDNRLQRLRKDLGSLDCLPEA